MASRDLCSPPQAVGGTTKQQTNTYSMSACKSSKTRKPLDLMVLPMKR